jgi:hypothetical protein
MGLLDSTGAVVDQEFLVTYQITCKFKAKDEQMAGRMLDRAISIGVSMAPQIVGIGCVAVPATTENLAQFGIDATNPVKS